MEILSPRMHHSRLSPSVSRVAPVTKLSFSVPAMAGKDDKTPPVEEEQELSMVERLRAASGKAAPTPSPTPETTPEPKPAPTDRGNVSAGSKAAADGALPRNRSMSQPPPCMTPYVPATPLITLGVLDVEGHYTIFQIDFDLDAGLLKEVCHRRSQELHPDKNPVGPYSSSKMALLMQAYKVLKTAVLVPTRFQVSGSLLSQVQS